MNWTRAPKLVVLIKIVLPFIDQKDAKHTVNSLISGSEPVLIIYGIIHGVFYGFY